MPTIQNPQLNHVSFSWREEGDLFHRELVALHTGYDSLDRCWEMFPSCG
jgi:hypothetical protein